MGKKAQPTGASAKKDERVFEITLRPAGDGFVSEDKVRQLNELWDARHKPSATGNAIGARRAR